jgi:Mn-dependent DtxR family transcriptional regulator
MLAEFIKMIGADEDTANKDAEGIEHYLQPKTLEKLEQFIEDIKKKRSKGKVRNWLPSLLLTILTNRISHNVDV